MIQLFSSGNKSMSEPQEELTLELNKHKLFNDVLKFILRKKLDGDPGPLLDQLEQVFFDRWQAVKDKDQAKAEDLEVKERDLVNKILSMSAKDS